MMKQTATRDEEIVRRAFELLSNDPCALGNVISLLCVTDREILNVDLHPAQLSGSPLTVLHRKRIFAAKKKLRQELVRIALELKLVSENEKIPTSDLWFRSTSSDGFFLCEHPQKRHAEFFDPLKIDFLHFLRAQI